MYETYVSGQSRHSRQHDISSTGTRLVLHFLHMCAMEFLRMSCMVSELKLSAGFEQILQFSKRSVPQTIAS